MAAHQVWELVCDVDGCGRNLIAADPDETLDQTVDGAGWGWDHALGAVRLLCDHHHAEHRAGRPLTPAQADAF